MTHSSTYTKTHNKCTCAKHTQKIDSMNYNDTRFKSMNPASKQ